MAHDNLATYLNDHLAGADAALELLEHLERTHAGTAVGRMISELRTEITADRTTLKSIMERLHVSESVPRKAAAWLAERLATVKLRLDDSGQGEFRLFESLEVVSLGIEGKLGLWRALTSVAPSVVELRGLGYEALIQRATEQRARVEALRLEVGPAALAPNV